MEWLQWIYIILAIVGTLVTTTVPAIIALVKSIKKRAEAKTEAEKTAAQNDMLNAVNGFIASAETLYKDIDSILKSQGKTSGANKKDSVMTKLQAYAIEKGYTFDGDFWSAKIDEIVALTREVNAK